MQVKSNFILHIPKNVKSSNYIKVGFKFRVLNIKVHVYKLLSRKETVISIKQNLFLLRLWMNIRRLSYPVKILQKHHSWKYLKKAVLYNVS